MEVKTAEHQNNSTVSTIMSTGLPQFPDCKSDHAIITILGMGKSCLVLDVLPPGGANEAGSHNVFQSLNDEISWGEMSHKGGIVPRLVCNQGTIYHQKESTHVPAASTPTAFKPIYRHPAAIPPPLISWTPTVEQIRHKAQDLCGHPLNHALIQLYRGGDDYISEHADKTLDIKKGSYICNYSCGALRTMIFRWKKSARGNITKQDDGTNGKMCDAVAVYNAGIHYKSDMGQQQQLPIVSTKDKEFMLKKQKVTKQDKLKVPMKHNSLFLLDPQTNQFMLHSIKRDRRPKCEKTAEELAEGGARISITFRWIHTFERTTDGMLFGGGSKRKHGFEVDDNQECIMFHDHQYSNRTHGENTHCQKPTTTHGNGETIETAADDGKEMLIAFSRENTEADSFDWEELYGSGFDAKEAPLL